MKQEERSLLEPPFWSRTSLIQIGYGFWVNQVIVMMGFAFGFSSVAIPQLHEEMHLTTSQEAWIAGILTLGSPIGGVISGYIADKYGRRPAMILTLIPMSVGWFSTALANTPQYVIMGRVITGIGLGMASTSPRTYVTEIALPNIRGVLGVLPSVALSLGLSLQSGMGTTFHWKTLCYISGLYSTLLFFLNFLLPESPYYLLMKGNLHQAKINLIKFRSKHYSCDLELEELQAFKENNDIRRLNFKESIMTLFKPASCKPFSIIAIYSLAGQFSGITIVIFYGVEMLQMANSSVDPFFGNLFFSLSRLVGGLFTAVLVYNMRRRTLAVLSAACTTITIWIVGLYVMYLPYPSVLPFLGFLLFIFFSVIGYLTLPLMMLFEMIPLQVRGLLGGITLSMLNLLVFVSNCGYPFVRNFFGYAKTLVAFGFSSLLGTLFVYFYLPETKGLTLQEIEEFYNKRRPSLASQREVVVRKRTSQMLHQKSLQATHLSSVNSKQDDSSSPPKITKSSVTFIDDNNIVNK